MVEISGWKRNVGKRGESSFETMEGFRGEKRADRMAGEGEKRFWERGAGYQSDRDGSHLQKKVKGEGPLLVGGRW